MKYMAEADLIITRPGGATTAELRSLGKPTVTFSEVPKDWQNHEGGNIRALASTGQSKHMELPLKIDTDSKALKRAVSSALKSVDKDYGKMVEGGKEAAIDSLANQNSMAKKVLSTKSFTSRAKSLPFKAWIGASAGTGALGLVGAYLAKKGKNK
jgi:UDP-N-acetylglucosamine:LPS N-acetylglucosamine transferase